MKRQLYRFFPQDDNSEITEKNNLEGPNLANQPPQCDQTAAPVKRRQVDEHESSDLSRQQKRRIVKLRLGSPQNQTPRRSMRLEHLNNTCRRTNRVLKRRAEVLKPSPAVIKQNKDRAHKSCLLREKSDNATKAVLEETTGDSLVALC